MSEFLLCSPVATVRNERNVRIFTHKSLYCTALSADVPGPVAGEPTVVDSGRNWLTLSWPKSEVRGGAPVLAYRVEAWPLGGDGGARWIEVRVTSLPVQNLNVRVCEVTQL